MASMTTFRLNDRNMFQPRANNDYHFDFRQPTEVAKSFDVSIKQLDIKMLKRKRLLGRGGLCEAWQCTYQGNNVVTKNPLESATPHATKSMFRAAQQQLKFEHKNVLKVLGVFEELKPPTILLELAEGGTLSDLLSKKVDLLTKWRLAKEISEAVLYLHDQDPFPCAHRDLNGSNVLLTKDGHAKLADFDLLVEIPEGVLVSGLSGTPGYMAPEMLQGPGYDHLVDIWSLGSLFYEITHQIGPYYKEVKDLNGPMTVDRFVSIVLQLTVKGSRPKLDPSCPKTMRDLIMDCWKQNPADRPDAVQVLIRLDEMQAVFAP